MPTALIEVRRRWSDDEEVAIIDAVHDALVAAFAIPPKDKHVRLVEHQPHRFGVSSTMPGAEFMTLVTIDCVAGRSIDAKRQLCVEIVDRLAHLGVPGDCVLITVRDIPAESWGIRGGQAACDVDLGFNVHV